MLLAGIEKSTPSLINDQGSQWVCKYFNNQAKQGDLSFAAYERFGKTVEEVFPAKEGTVVVGDPVPSGAQMITSVENLPEAYYKKVVPMPSGIM